MKRPYEDPDSDTNSKPSSYDRHRRYYSKSSFPRTSPDRHRSHRRHDRSSSLRRDLPNAFRSDRDRHRRDTGSSWRRPSDEIRSPSDSAGTRDRAHFRPRDDVRTVKLEDRGKEPEIEEGELQPEPDADPGPKEADKDGSDDSSEYKEILRNELGLNDEAASNGGLEEGVPEDPNVSGEKLGVSEMVVDRGEVRVSDRDVRGEKLRVGDRDVRGEKLGVSEKAVDRDVRGEKLPEARNDVVDLVDVEGDGEVGRRLEESKRKIVKEETMSSPSRGKELKAQGEERAVEEARTLPTELELISSSRPLKALELEEVQGDDRFVGVEGRGTEKEAVGNDFQLKLIERRGFDSEVEPKGVRTFLDLCKEDAIESRSDEDDVNVMEPHKDKGKVPENKVNSSGDDAAMEGTSGRGFELVFRSELTPPEQATLCDAKAIRKQKEEKTKLEPLDLSLGLRGIPLDHTSESLNPKPSSPSRGGSIQSLPSSFRTSSFRTMSDGFTTSISFSGHNPSCSLTHNSNDNFEGSVGSHPIFKGVDQLSNGTIWQGLPSNDPKLLGGGGRLFQGVDQSNGTVWKGQTSSELKRNSGSGALFHRALLNGSPSDSSLHLLRGQHQSIPDSLSRQSSLPRQLNLAHSHGSRDTWSENSNDKRVLTKARSSSSLFRSEQKEGEPVLNGVGVVERILSKIVTEPLQVTSRMLHEMTEPSVTYLKETISLMVDNRDKHAHILALQEALKRRSDLTVGTMSNCTRVLLEILVAIKTRLTDFLRIHDNVPSTDLVEIFLNLKCCNLACRSMLPVDECDCRVCVQKNGFCRECMCLVCSKFDMASNTCSWVGCDICLHWCHTDCGLRESHIRNGRSSSGAQGSTEMQFHCVACDHPSEMFGFVKEVFKTCSKVWRVETLVKELEYVRRIFSASNDARGNKMCDLADQMLTKLEDKSNTSEVISYILSFLSEDDSNIRIDPSRFSSKGPSIHGEASNMIACPKKDSTWLPSVSAEKVSHIDSMAVLSGMNDKIGRQARDAELQVNFEKKPVVDELDSVVRLKQAEAKMYQERADDARREAEGLKRIAVAKSVKIEEDYATRIARLRLTESQERHRQKLEELQVIERAQREYFNMKVRMESDIKDLLLKMEATKRNFST